MLGPSRGVVNSARAQARKNVLAAHEVDVENEMRRLLMAQGFVPEATVKWVAAPSGESDAGAE